MSKEQEFIEKMAKACGDKLRKNGILTSVGIAQSILESGWGTSWLAVVANNYHALNNYNDNVTYIYKGIMYDYAPQERDGKTIIQRECFCKFDEPEESFECLARWYTMREKYRPIIGEKDFEKVANYLQGRYATSTKYAGSLIRIYNTYNLAVFDDLKPTTYYVQAGAYKTPQGARSIATAMKIKDIPTIIKYDGEYYRVQAGAFSNVDYANRLCDKIKVLGFSAFVTDNIPGKEVR